MSTPQEEIDQQHQRAVESIKSDTCPYSSIPFTGEISLAQKGCPTIELFNNDENDASNIQNKSVDYPIPWSSRGHADVGQLQALVREGYNERKAKKRTNKANGSKNGQNQKRSVYKLKDVKSVTNLWDPINASVNNVSIHRPSHDAWGINKIVLIFCDDFLQSIYELPWWHETEKRGISAAVQPILDCLQIGRGQIVRLLLASLPPGVTIPVHHDSGEWVKHTHRVHVPVLVKNPNNIMFQCGLTDDTLQRIDCSPGHVFEINNQARHFVSNCDEDHRVHLILDYVEQDYQRLHQLERIRLNAGEIIVQTRRTIDRLSDKGRRPTPSFLILGVQKAGTTSLYEYMTQHPLVVRARRRETHCLDWRWNDNLKTTKLRRQWCQKFFFEKDLQLHPSCMSGDSTPSYLLDSRRVIPRLKEVFDWPIKFFVMLRDPIQRAESHYAMVTSSKGTEAQLKTRGTEWRNKSFRQVVMDDFQKMKDCGLIPYWNIQTGTLDERIFNEFSNSSQEDIAWDRYLSDHVLLNSGSYGLLSRGLYALNLRPWLRAFDKSDFLVLRLENFKQAHCNDASSSSIAADDAVQTTMTKVWKHLEVPEVKIQDTTPQNSRDYHSALDSELRQMLEQFYQAHNQRLEKLLGTEWIGAWTYH